MGDNSQNFELACKEAVFHFNKKHLEDPTIPMWVIKAKGESYYVEHVECNIPWSTKETPDNNHTKGSLKIKRCHLVIDDDNVAHLNELTPEIEERLNNPQVVIRVITMYGDKLRKACEMVGHTNEIKTVGGACSTTFYITEFNSDEDYVMFKMACTASDLRELKPNETYYKMYDKKTDDGYIDEDEWFSDEDLYDDEDLSHQALQIG